MFPSSIEYEGEYRIVEEPFDKFTVERKVVWVYKYGFWWNRKRRETVHWYKLDKYGKTIYPKGAIEFDSEPVAQRFMEWVEERNDKNHD